MSKNKYFNFRVNYSVLNLLFEMAGLNEFNMSAEMGSCFWLLKKQFHKIFCFQVYLIQLIVV